MVLPELIAPVLVLESRACNAAKNNLLFKAISAAVNTVTSSIGTSLLSKRKGITKSVETSLNTIGIEVKRNQRQKRSLSLGLIENHGIRNSLCQQLEKTLR